jgi:nicotinate-nucleotide adenylyltransferase
VSDAELKRPGPSYTYDTLTEIQRREGPGAELHLVVGADMLTDLPLWHRAEDLLELCKVIVVCRPPWDERMEDVLASLRGRLPAGAVERLRGSVATTPLIDISSTRIRRRVKEGRSIRFLVPDSVRSYIDSRGLYRA